MIGLYFAQVVLFSALPIYFTFLEKPVRQVSFFVCIALYLLIGGFFGNIYSLPLADGITVSGGNLCYGAFMMSSVLFVLVERDIFILRQLIRLVLFVDVFNIIFSLLVYQLLHNGKVINPHQISPGLFSVSVPFMILGGILIFTELFFLFFLFEKLKRLKVSYELKALIYILLFVCVLCADGILFPLIAFGVTPQVIAIVIGGFAGKVIMSLSFAIPLLLFILIRNKVFHEYLSSDQFRWNLMIMSSSDLMKDLLEKENRLHQAAAVFSHAHEGMALADEKGNLIRANPAFQQMMSIADEKNALNIDQFFSMEQQPFHINEVMKSAWCGEVDFHPQDDTLHHGILSINAVDTSQPNQKSFVYSLTNIDAIKQAQEKLSYLATHDQLTELPNRRLLERELISLQNKPLTMIIIDIDHFKDVNDSYEHIAGDIVLQQIAKRLNLVGQKYHPVRLFLCRTGGDEFAFVFSDPNSTVTAKLAADIQEAVKEKVIFQETVELYISASIGISEHATALSNPQDVLQEADAALYDAKRRQRGSVAYYQQALTMVSHRRLELAARLRDALTDGGITVYFQPQVDAVTETMTGVEALVRWFDVENGFISPAEFIPVAESCGLIEELGEYVLERSCEQGVRWFAAGYTPFKISVNVSPIQLRFGLLPTVVERILQKTGFPAQYLELELTESALLEREKEIRPQLNTLRQLGVGFAIDDFGTGYSSLSYLHSFPFTTLKIDRSFISDLPQNQTLCQLSAAIVALGKGMNMKLVAEGVETREQLEYLKQLGCHCIQGYFYSPAIPVDNMNTWLQKADAVICS